MPSKPRRRSKSAGTFTVGGTDRSFPTVGCALSFAQGRAAHAPEPVRLGVYDAGSQVYRVERHEDGAVSTVAV